MEEETEASYVRKEEVKCGQRGEEADRDRQGYISYYKISKWNFHVGTCAAGYCSVLRRNDLVSLFKLPMH